MRRFWLPLLLFAIAIWLLPPSAHARFLKPMDISLWNINHTWKQVRALLRKHNHPKNKTLFRMWDAMSEPSQGIKPHVPKGLLIPEWLADARRGTIWINVPYLKSLRRQFNGALFYHKKRMYATGDLDLIGAAWGEIWRGVVAMQHRRSKLRLLFAIKLLPGFEYARCRAHLQGLLRQRHGIVFSEETFEVGLLCLQHKRRVYRALMRHPILRRIWGMMFWKLSDRPIQRLLGEAHTLPKRLVETSAWKKTCPRKDLRQLVAYAYTALRRDRCSFCPGYSLHPTHTSISISLVQKGKTYLINREHYRSLTFGARGDLLSQLRMQWLSHARYINGFLQRIRAKGARHMARLEYYETNLMIPLIRRYSWMLREHIQLLLQPWTTRTIKVFYEQLLRQRLRAKLPEIAACIKATETHWISHALPYLYQTLHP